MKCKYCGKPAGFFRFSHNECKALHDESINNLKTLVHDKISTACNYSEICEQSAGTIQTGYISQAEFQYILSTEIRAQISTSTRPYQLLNFITELPQSVRSAFYNTTGYISFRDNTIQSIADEIFRTPEISNDEFQKLKTISVNSGHNKLNEIVIAELEKRVNQYLEDGLIEVEEEEALGHFIENTGIEVSEISKSQAYANFMQSLILRDIQEGKQPNRITFNSLPILMTKKEYPIWAYNNIKGYEEKTGKRYVGGSRGTSVRICKGVYYRVGASKGYSVDYQYSQPLGVGSLIITNRALYYVSPSKTIKVLISKIVSVEPYSDGIAIVKDGVRANPLYFVGFDSWFMMNLLPLLNE